MNPAALAIAKPLGLKDWLDLDDAREAARSIAYTRRSLDDQYQAQVTKAAEAEANYRRELAKRVTTYRADGKGAGEAELIARGDIANLSQQRDIEQGMLKALQFRIDACDGERANLRQLMAWSQGLRIGGER